MLIAPFTFNALRFGIGALSLIPLLMYKKKTDKFEGKGGRKDLRALRVLLHDVSSRRSFAKKFSQSVVLKVALTGLVHHSQFELPCEVEPSKALMIMTLVFFQ